jgi:hypothetical protein
MIDQSTDLRVHPFQKAAARVAAALRRLRPFSMS